MIWLWTSVLSALLLGCYDIAKKQSLKRNGVLEVLLIATGLSTLFLFPVLIGPHPATLQMHLLLLIKSLLVAGSWICGIIGLKHLPLTTVGIIKATRPVFVLLGCLLLFGEVLNLMQWAGIVVAILALTLLGLSSRNEGIFFHRDRWVWCMGLSVLFGVVSALFDKQIVSNLKLPPVFTLAWCDLYVTILIAICVAVNRTLLRKKAAPVVGMPSRRSGILPGNYPAERDGSRQGAGAAGTESGFAEQTGGRVPLRPDSVPGIVPFRWDWSLLLIAVFITISDILYFYSLSCEGSLLAVVSMLRRSSVVVTFLGGAILFKEKNLLAKGWVLLLLLAGMVLLFLGSR